MTPILTAENKALIAACAEDYRQRSESLDVQELARTIKVRASVIYNHLRRKKIDYKRRRELRTKTDRTFAPGCFNPYERANWLV